MRSSRFYGKGIWDPDTMEACGAKEDALTDFQLWMMMLLS